MDSILEISNNNNIFLLEDCCEAHGSKYKNKKLGTFGIMSSFSFYYGHHMSNHRRGNGFLRIAKKMNSFLLMIRSHGWIRDLDKESAKIIKRKYNIDDFKFCLFFYSPRFKCKINRSKRFFRNKTTKRIRYCCRKKEEKITIYTNQD